MTMLSLKTAPTTQIQINDEQRIVVIRHVFPLSFHVETIATNFISKAQGFAMTTVTIPTVDLLALAALIVEHVPKDVAYEEQRPFRQMNVRTDKDIVFSTLGMMRDLSAEERASTEDVHTFLHTTYSQRKTKCQIS